MPIYEYRCKKCNHQFEVFQKLNEENLKNCPRCGGPLQKVISSPAIQFKGSGWYITDYAHKNSPAGGNGKNNHKTAAGPEKKSEAKTVSKEENPNQRK